MSDEDDLEPTRHQEYLMQTAIQKVHQKVTGDEFSAKLDALKEQYGGVENIPSDEIGKIMFIGTSAQEMAMSMHRCMTIFQLCNIAGIRLQGTYLGQLYAWAVRGEIPEDEIEWADRIFNTDLFRQEMYNYMLEKGDVTHSGMYLRLSKENWDQFQAWLKVPYPEQNGADADMFDPPIADLEKTDGHIDKDDDEQEAT